MKPNDPTATPLEFEPDAVYGLAKDQKYEYFHVVIKGTKAGSPNHIIEMKVDPTK